LSVTRLAFVCLASAACSAPVANVTDTALPLTPCRLKGLSAPANCGTLSVAEDRSVPGGRRIALRVAVVPASLRPAAPDPLFVLVGGPGQAATEAGAPLAQILLEVRRHRDIVLVDQRGTGASNPLDCVLHDPDDMAAALDDPVPLGVLAKCVKGWDADTRRYRTTDAADDLEAVREALGYPQIDLWGASYGTRLALEYLRRHGEHARAVVLDGVAPAGMVLPLAAAKDGQAALERILDDAAEEFPTLRAELEQLLALPPRQLTVAHPRTGVAQTLTVDRDDIAALIRGALYSPELTSILPLAIRRALAGDLGTFAAISVAMSAGVEEGLSLGLMLAVICAEDVPRIKPGDLQKAVQGTIFGPDLVQPMVDACSVVPTEPVPQSLDKPVVSDVPTLILSGGADPATPPHWGERAASGLSRARHVQVEEMAHGLTVRGCVPDLVADFLVAGSGDELDVGCADKIRRPPFFVRRTGPTP